MRAEAAACKSPVRGDDRRDGHQSSALQKFLIPKSKIVPHRTGSVDSTVGLHYTNGTGRGAPAMYVSSLPGFIFIDYDLWLGYPISYLRRVCPQNWYGNCSTSRYLLLSQARAVRMHDPACLGTWRRARAAPQTRERQHVFVLGLGIPTVRYGLRPVLVYAPFLYCGCESQTTTTHRIPPLRASSRYSPSFGLASKFGLSGARRRRPSFGRPSGGGGRLYVGAFRVGLRGIRGTALLCWRK